MTSESNPRTNDNEDSQELVHSSQGQALSSDAGYIWDIGELFPAKIEWPGFVKHSSGWWLTAYGFSAGFVALFCVLSTSFLAHPKIVLATALLTPPLLVVVEYFWNVLRVAYKRHAQYNELHDQVTDARELFDQSKQQLSRSQSLIQYLLGSIPSRIEIMKVQVFNEAVFLTLKTRKANKLQIGAELLVIDFNEAIALGSFRITQVEPTCIAKADGPIDPIWSGYLHLAGAESSAPPNSAAILIDRSHTSNE